MTSGAEFLGTAGPFAVEVPWWSEVEPVIASLRRALGVDVLVLRLLGVEGGVGGRDGHVTYHVEALERPASGLLSPPPVSPFASPFAPHELRSPWARLEGVRELYGWASAALAAAGRTVTGPIRQRRTWNLSGLFRLPTDRGTAWLKALPPFSADEAAAIAAFAGADPGLVPTVIAAGPGRILLEDLPGVDGWNAPGEALASAVTRLVAAQATLGGSAVPGLPELTGPSQDERVLALLARLGEVAPPTGLTREESAAAHRLLGRRSLLERCGLPETVVHGDFHPGNWRADGGPPVVYDFADAHIGDPVLDGLRVLAFLPRERRPAAARAWIDAWRAHAPGSDPAGALTIAEPLAHLHYAVRYQEFLDGIEPSERIYHLDDPSTEIRAALRAGSL
ncbi:aminoglycoside phosphotransferase family protein [Spongiactinospora gelatinilytica]|uniref:Aminoglycoside phosphotransferase family protein n=1 Tax=Spongiactinospora gelatinilytica TaxID=2666298 RepID=A0A2W2EJT5_9ACTN|nr:aminoglycoside phosphotransferase family protein [Spongiactinospora gelatinilytica]PZG24566.1 aminoglycoside phosphotransferase family protein [Spongiactinospora gelatinilytica]